MDKMQIMCTLKNVKSFLGVFPSDPLPHSITQSGTIIIDAHPHTEKGSHWLAIHFQRRLYSAYYFDSYGIGKFIPNILAFLRRICTVWKFNTIQLQGLISAGCAKYCSLFALYMDRCYTQTIRRPLQSRHRRRTVLRIIIGTATQRTSRGSMQLKYL